MPLLRRQSILRGLLPKNGSASPMLAGVYCIDEGLTDKQVGNATNKVHITRKDGPSHMPWYYLSQPYVAVSHFC